MLQVEAFVSANTVRKWARGELVLPSTAERIRRASVKLGIVVLA